MLHVSLTVCLVHLELVLFSRHALEIAKSKVGPCRFKGSESKGRKETANNDFN